jgi:hypothetical protein
MNSRAMGQLLFVARATIMPTPRPANRVAGEEALWTKPHVGRNRFALPSTTSTGGRGQS